MIKVLIFLSNENCFGTTPEGLVSHGLSTTDLCVTHKNLQPPSKIFFECRPKDLPIRLSP